MDYNEFRTIITRRESKLDRRTENRLATELDDLFTPESVKGFYAKNIINGGEETLYFFQESSITQIRIEGDGFKLKTIMNSAIQKISLDIPVYFQNGITLTLAFSDGSVMVLNSLEDSNIEWNDEYYSNIKALYKMLLEQKEQSPTT